MKTPLHYILFAFLFFACNEQQEFSAQVENANPSEINFPETKVALVGNAKQEALEWDDYKAFNVALENYNHTIDVTERMVKIVKNMRSDILPQFDNQQIKSRLLVLESRLSRYASFLKYRTRTAQNYQEYYGDIILAMDQLNGQLNEKALIDQLENELIEELNSDVQEIQPEPSNNSRL